MRILVKGFQLLTGLPRKLKKIILLLFDLSILSMAFLTAVIIKMEAEWWSSFQELSGFLLIFMFFSAPTNIKLGLYQNIIRFITHATYFNVVKAQVISVLLALVGTFLVSLPMPHWSILVLTSMLSIMSMCLSRILVRGLYESIDSHKLKKNTVAIYGAGVTGAQLAYSLKMDGCLTPVVFIDDKQELQGNQVAGIKVISPQNIQSFIERLGISQIILAMPSVPFSARKKIINSLQVHQVKVLAVPNISELARGDKQVNDLRDIEITDLLGREPVPPQAQLLHASTKGKVVMVTGAGGSIGSELCRQILAAKPTHLILLERSEFALYEIEKELQASASKDTQIISLLSSVLNADSLDSAIQKYSVQTIYHAAAYKHVPIVESHIIEGVKNNIFGTLELAKAALINNVEKFVLISTDKAVRPSNVMGATKRFAEMILQSLPSSEYMQESNQTCFCMVRFGNVLNSSGSVIPLFKEQISKGGPITVTHYDITRFFMTISEAAQLVLQAGSMAEQGDLFLLDMGEPVKILDLAKKMIHLSGLSIRDELNLEGDIGIEITGLRPGEKLYEELLIENDCVGTLHPRIMKELAKRPQWHQVEHHLGEFSKAIDELDVELARQTLLNAVEGYRPMSSQNTHESATLQAA